MKRFIVLVLDSFGVGEMADVKETRVKDIGANTYKSVLESNVDIKIETLEKLGIANAANLEINNIRFSEKASFGTSNLLHFGCDTFYGHQELMGTLPKKPEREPFYENIDMVKEALEKAGYFVEKFGEKARVLVVNNCATVGDNLEADLGQVYNITGALDLITYENLLKIGKVVREVVKVPRVITFGGEEVSLDDIKSAYECRDGVFGGINAPKSGVYKKGYRVEHMGYGIDSEVQLPKILGEGIKTILLGKVADIVANPYGISDPVIDSGKVMDELIYHVKENEIGFFCANIQETDLAGHQEDAKKYAEKLQIVDEKLKNLIDILSDEDILIVTADHGNDPNIGHSNHTREKVPVLIYKRGLEGIEIGERGSLADIGQTAADYFNKTLPDNGISFLDKLK